MNKSQRKNITSGILLILLGLAFLALQLVPGVRTWLEDQYAWPMNVMLVALGLIVIGILTGEADMLVPASIVGGIGGILYLQNSGVLTWESWAYAWTLIPGFVGLGIFLAGLIKWKKSQVFEGLQTMLVSAVLFLVFGSLIGDAFGYFPFSTYLPVLLIALGLFLFIRALVNRK
jgi:hypothetical protein